MTEAEKSGAIKQLKRLRKKADQCRYANERMRDGAGGWRRASGILTAVLSFLLSLLAVMLYRDLLPGDDNIWLAGVAILPPLILLIQGVGGVFAWADRESECAAAVHIWGQWIREADFFEKKIPHLSEDAAREGMREMERKYTDCMGKAPLIPARKFLRHKIEYRRQRMLSERIDDADENELAEIARHLDRPKPRGR